MCITAQKAGGPVLVTHGNAKDLLLNQVQSHSHSHFSDLSMSTMPQVSPGENGVSIILDHAACHQN